MGAKLNVAVLGLGIFGETLALELSDRGHDVLAIDNSEKKVENVTDFVTRTAVGDMKELAFLESVGVGECDIAVIATGTKLESAVLATMHCRALGVKRIVAKAKNEEFETVLRALGVEEIVRPEKSAGKHLVARLANKKIREFLKLDDDMAICEFGTPDTWVGKSILDLDLRRRYEMNVIGIKRGSVDHMDVNFDVSAPLQADEKLIAIMNGERFEDLDV